MNLLMITGDRVLAAGKRGAFYNTLEEFHKYWDRIDIICPNVKIRMSNVKVFGNVFIHSSPWPVIFQPFWILYKGSQIIHHSSLAIGHFLMTCHDYPPFYNGIGAWLLSKATKIPYILEIMHIPGHPHAAGIKEKIYKQLMRWLVRFDAKNAKAVRVINQKEVPDFLAQAGIPREKIKYIPANYIDLEIFKPITHNLQPTTKKYDLTFIGRLVENKGISLLLDALKILNTKYSIQNTKLLIVGSGPEMENLKFKIGNLKLENNVVLYGWAKDQAEIAQLLNQSRIMIMPSYNEGGPRVVLEAMACGVPVLATPVGIVPDLLKNGLGGAIIDWNADDIARKIQRLLSDSGAYLQHSRAGIEIAAKFEKKAAIRNYAEQLKFLASSS